MSKEIWIIRSSDNPDEYWSNEFGWTDIDDADVFTNQERHKLALPIGGKWLQINDLPQANA